MHCRERLEECDAALCPSVAYQLAGAKKVQQDLARPEVLERFLDKAQQVELIRACFAGRGNTSHQFIDGHSSPKPSKHTTHLHMPCVSMIILCMFQQQVL